MTTEILNAEVFIKRVKMALAEAGYPNVYVFSSGVLDDGWP